MKKIKILITLGLYLVAGCFVFASLAQAKTPSTATKNVWTDRQTFKCDVDMWQDFEFKDGSTISGDPTVSGDWTFTGDVTFSNGVVFNDEVVTEAYSHASSNAAGTGTDSLTWAFSYGNTLYISGASAFTLTLPQGTAAYKGYRLLVKNTADAATRTINAYYTGVSGATDYIETFRGDSQTTSTSDTTIDQVGEWRMWKADMDSSGTTGYWRLIGDGAIGNAISLTKDSGTSTFTLTETIALSGHVFLLPTATCGTGGPLDAVGANGMASGVTTVLPTPTAAMDGWEMTFVNSSGSGVSPFFLYVDGVATIGYASGTTSGVATNFNGTYEVIPDAQGDTITVVADFDSAVSYWVKSFNFR